MGWESKEWLCQSIASGFVRDPGESGLPSDEAQDLSPRRSGEISLVAESAPAFIRKVNMTITAQQRAAIQMIGMSEGTITHPLTKHGGYDVIVTGIQLPKQEVFYDFAYHPFALGFDPQQYRPGLILPGWRHPKVINADDLESTAAGIGQILRRFWLAEAKALHLADFSAASQDAYIVQQFRERYALAALEAGKFIEFCNAISGLWASMPGKSYPGQPQRSLERVRAFFEAAGGTVSD